MPRSTPYEALSSSSPFPEIMLPQISDSLSTLPRLSGETSRPNPPVRVVKSSDRHISLSVLCDGQEIVGGVDHKQVKGMDDRTLVNPDVVRDVVIGLSDGLTVPFALTAGLSSLGESRVVILGGAAELIAGAISMGIGGFLASQAERDHYLFLKHRTALRVLRSGDKEMESEVYNVLAPVGVDEPTSRAVSKCLRAAECRTVAVSNGLSSPHENTRHLQLESDVGLTPFLLKFGQGLEEVPTSRLYKSAITIGLGYLVGGIIPLIPYFCFTRAHVALIYSCALTGLVLLVFGAVKARISGAGRGIKGYIWGAVSTLLVGGAAAGIAYGIVVVLKA